MLIPEACVTELIHAIEGHPTPARPVPVPSKDRPAADGSRAAGQPLAEAPPQHYMKPLPEHPAPRDRTSILTEADFCGYMPRSTPRSAGDHSTFAAWIGVVHARQLPVPGAKAACRLVSCLNARLL